MVDKVANDVMTNLHIWLPPLIAALAGTFVGWLLSTLSSRQLLNRARDSASVSLHAEIEGIKNELESLKGRIEVAKTKGQQDYVFFSPPLFHRKFHFQTWDMLRHSPNLYLLNPEAVALLVKFNTELHWFNMAYEDFSGAGVSRPTSVAEILELDENVEENKNRKIFFHQFCQTLDELITFAEKICSLVYLPHVQKLT